MAVIEVRDVHKTFRIPRERHTTLTERVLHLFRPIQYERFEALRGVDLDIEEGSFIGIIGRNGSGKSTLLKIIAGLLLPDAGAVRVTGSMSALLELGLGFSGELTVRENIELYAAVLGYPRREITARIDEAIHFAELERFRDAKLKNLSTGMRARLGFATALQAEADILLLDEILAVGDQSFQHKCLEVFMDLKQRRRTIVLVSHDLNQVHRLCDRAFFVDAGRIAAHGRPDEVIECYLASLAREMASAEADAAPAAAVDAPPAAAVDAPPAAAVDAPPATAVDPPPAPEEPTSQPAESERIRFIFGWLEDEAGNRVDSVRPGDRPVFVCIANVMADAEEPTFGIMVNEKNGPIISVMSTRWLDVSIGVLRAGQTVELRLPFDAALREGPYIANVIAGHTERAVLYGKTTDFLDFSVDGRVAQRRAADLRAGFSCRVMSSAEAPNDWEEARLTERRNAR